MVARLHPKDYSSWQINQRGGVRKGDLYRIAGPSGNDQGRHHMSEDVFKEPEYGPEKFRAIFQRGMDIAGNRLLQRAEGESGNLSVDELREELLAIKDNPDPGAHDYFQAAWKECSQAVEHLRWDRERRYPFERLMVNTFIHLMPRGDQVPIVGQHLPRGIIPGFVIALEQMLGEEVEEKYQEFCRGLVARMKTQLGPGFNWEEIHNDPRTHDLVTKVLVEIAHHFVDMRKRRRWMTDLITSHMGAPTAAQDVPFEDMECHRMIAAMYQPLRDAMNTEEGEAQITERYGRDNARMLRAVFAEITRDHRELSLGLNRPAG
jgi:hypothetical protein